MAATPVACLHELSAGLGQGAVRSADVVGVGGAGGADPLGRAGLVDADAFGEDRAGSRAASASSATWRPARLVMP